MFIEPVTIKQISRHERQMPLMPEKQNQEPLEL